MKSLKEYRENLSESNNDSWEKAAKFNSLEAFFIEKRKSLLREYELWEGMERTLGNTISGLRLNMDSSQNLSDLMDKMKFGNIKLPSKQAKQIKELQKVVKETFGK